MLTYLPLDPENREIRLVRLRLPEAESALAAETDADIITLDLRHVSMNDGVPYGAVSYVWGSSVASDLIEIRVNDQTHLVGKNLHAALTEFRRQKVSGWLWIDAICIHQSDQEEKSWHVDRMRDVFQEAELVHIWLGPAAPGTDTAMDLIIRYGPRAFKSNAIHLRKRIHLFGWEGHDIMSYLSQFKGQPQEPPELTWVPKVGPFTAMTVQLGDMIYDFMHESGWEKAFKGKRTIAPNSLIAGMQDLLRRDYWHRIWVIQEVALARQGQVYCGAKTVSLDELDAVWTTLFFCVQRQPDKVLPGTQNLRGPFHGGLYPNKAMTTRLSRRLPDPDVSLGFMDYLLEFGSAPRRYHYTASDPRDLVYGLLGVLSPTERLGIHADYTMTSGRVLAKFTKAVLGTAGSSLDLNHSFPRQGHIPDCPSWVPDWVTIGKYGPVPYPFKTGYDWRNYEASGELLQPDNLKYDITPDYMTLRRAGCRVAIITEVMEAPEWVRPSEWPCDWRIKDHEKWLQDIKEFVGLGIETGPAEDYIWRTLAQRHKDHRPVEHSDGLNQWRDENNHIVRKIMRREPIDPNELSETEAEFFWKGPYAYYLDGWGVDRLEDRIDQLMHNWVMMCLALPERTFFKTNKGMFGIGHISVQPGDILALIWEVPAPMVLRPREEGGFTVQGDAYVDGIMHGEFLETNPAHEEFVLY
ncbi:Heterokaryon incompatibility protein (HET) domain containing protein [Naviculisporaceae sp. PSN 640]